jgi:hypothetical protein
MINSTSGTGPKEQTVTIGEGKLGKGVNGFYKWDTKPDTQPTSSQGAAGGNAVPWTLQKMISDAHKMGLKNLEQSLIKEAQKLSTKQ